MNMYLYTKAYNSYHFLGSKKAWEYAYNYMYLKHAKWYEDLA